jgi:NAD(P)-dependent dehydrogenase (short-subunit alcohol dehydrogenase family)
MPNALVTGGNRGLGLETARELARRGFRVVVTARAAADGERAVRELGAGVSFVVLDVADAASVARAVSSLPPDFELHALVNNAGTSLDGFDADVAARTIETNFRGAVRVTDALLPRLAANANIVMVSSGMGELSAASPELRRRLLDAGLTRKVLDALVDDFVLRVREDARDLGGWPRNAYRVSKIALNAFTRLLARALGDGRRVNAVCPGWVRTRMGGPAASRSVERGAAGIVWAATLGSDGPNGGFFRDSRAIDW